MQVERVDRVHRTELAPEIPERVLCRDLGLHVRAHHADPGLSGSPDHVAKQLHGGVVGVVEVVHHQENGILGRELGERDGHGIEEAEPLARGVDGRHGRRSLDGILQPDHQAGQLGPLPRGHGGEAVGRERLEVAAQRFGKGLVRGNGIPVASAVQGHVAAAGHCPGKLGHQPRLADAGLTLDDDGPAPVGAHCVPPAPEPAELVVAASESKEVVAFRTEPLGSRRLGLARHDPARLLCPLCQDGKIQCRVVGEDGMLHPGDIVPGLDPQLGNQDGAQILVHAQRLGLTS